MLKNLARAIIDDRDAPPVAVLAAAWLLIHDNPEPLRSLVEAAS